MDKESNSGQDKFSVLFDSINKPSERIQKNCDQLKMVAWALEAGKEVAPKKIKRLAGSISYWNEKAWYAGANLLVFPLRSLMAAKESSRSLKEEPSQEPFSEEEKALALKLFKGSLSLMKVFDKVKAGELPEAEFDSLIDRAEELAA
jgi:hypothetical protein